jgi:rhodanese-related sulfurtransferase|tara:strand:- start:13724 stop:14308 length:585 start_codon:yes stop_codon:yes gene_type:complete
MPTLASTLSRFLAIVGLGFLLATGHQFVRTAWLGHPSIVLTRAAPTPDNTPLPAPVGTDPTPVQPDPVEMPDQPASPLDAPVKDGSITLREAYELFEQGVFFLDARHEEDFNAGHIEGAFWMPAARVTTEEGRTDLSIIEPGGTVVIYCTGGDCDASENTALRIERMGFNFDIRILGKGYTDWVDAGLPTGVAP